MSDTEQSELADRARAALAALDLFMAADEAALEERDNDLVRTMARLAEALPASVSTPLDLACAMVLGSYAIARLIQDHGNDEDAVRLRFAAMMHGVATLREVLAGASKRLNEDARGIVALTRDAAARTAPLPRDRRS